MYFLLFFLFQGEGVTDESVWIIKSHYPERIGYVRFKCSRVIVLIRNPFDSLLSYFHMGMTNTHNRTLAPEVLQIPFVFSRINACGKSEHK